MSDKPHSARVRGTLDNPKTKEAIKNNERPPAIGDPGSLKAENTNTNPVPGNSNQDGGNADLGRSSSSSGSSSGSGSGGNSGGGPSKQRRENDATAYADVTGKKKAQSDATAYADGGRGGGLADKEENKNFDPRKYRESIGKDGGGGENAGIEWSNTSKEGEKGVQNEKIEGVEWTEKSKL